MGCELLKYFKNVGSVYLHRWHKIIHGDKPKFPYIVGSIDFPLFNEIKAFNVSVSSCSMQIGLPNIYH